MLTTRKFIGKLYGLLRQNIYFWKLKQRNYGKGAKVVFSNYWKQNHWGIEETKSGEGSTLLYTEQIRREIPVLLKRLNATRLLDAPCGDFHWFKEVELGRHIHYIGGDIVDEMIEGLNEKYASSRREFIVIDVICDKLPIVDVWMCRDLIFHLPTSEIFRLIGNFLCSEVKYLLVTSHSVGGMKNNDTFMGGFRLIDLRKPPFNFPEPEEVMRDYIDGFPERALLLYKREALQSWQIINQR